MNQKEKFLTRLKSYIGYKEQENGWTRFGQAYADRHHSPSFAYADWCAMTIAGVAREVGIPETVIPDYAACTHYLNWFEEQGCRTGADEGAQAGDIVLYEWDGTEGAKDGPDHIGVVESVSCEDPDQQILTVIEGNYQDRVARRVISYRDPRVWATCRPKYDLTDIPTNKQVYAPFELSHGDDGDPVKLLQMALAMHGYNVGSAGVDGDLGQDTDKALRQFQADHGLTVDGIAGTDTWRALCGI